MLAFLLISARFNSGYAHLLVLLHCQAASQDSDRKRRDSRQPRGQIGRQTNKQTKVTLDST
jgi:hypothetical protein